jgi:predicted small metal-binding protein
MGMWVFRCKDMGMKCKFMYKGRTKTSVKKKAMAHAKKVHKAMLMKMTAKQKSAMMKKMVKVIKQMK